VSNGEAAAEASTKKEKTAATAPPIKDGEVKPTEPKNNEKGAVPTKKEVTVFVGGLAPTFDLEAFKNLFSKSGEIVDVSVPMSESRKGRAAVPRGFAFVTFASSKSAKRALQNAHSKFEGRTLKVTLSKTQGATTESVREDKKIAAREKDYTVFVTNLPHKATEVEVKAHFRECGNIAGCRILIDKGLAFIRFKREEGFKKGLELNQQEFQGRAINVEKAHGKNAGAAKSEAEVAKAESEAASSEGEES